MKKYILFGGCLLLLAYITSCDDGRIYEKTETLSEEGRTLRMSGRISGINKWPDGYSVVVAGFSDESEYAVVTKTIPAVENDEIQVTMTGVSDKVTTIELCVINRLRKRVISFRSMDDLTAVTTLFLWMWELWMQVCIMAFRKKYLILHVPTVMVEVVRQQATCI